MLALDDMNRAAEDRQALCGKRCFNSLNRLRRRRPIRPACLRHIRTATTALSADRFRPRTHQLYGISAACQIVGNPDNEGRLSIVNRDNGNNTGPDLFFSIDRQAASAPSAERLPIRVMRN